MFYLMQKIYLIKKTSQNYNLKYQLISFDEKNYQIKAGELKTNNGNISTFNGIIEKNKLTQSKDFLSLIKNSKIFNFRGGDIINKTDYIKKLNVPEKYINKDTKIKEMLILNKVDKEYRVEKLNLEISGLIKLNISGNFIYENNNFYILSGEISYKFENSELFNEINNKYNLKEKEKNLKIKEKTNILSIINLI